MVIPNNTRAVLFFRPVASEGQLGTLLKRYNWLCAPCTPRERTLIDVSLEIVHM